MAGRATGAAAAAQWPVSILLNCATGSAHAGNVDEARRLETKANGLGVEGKKCPLLKNLKAHRVLHAVRIGSSAPLG